MKKLLSIIVCLIFFSLEGLSQVKEVKTDIYTSIYNEEYQQPLIVEYTIFCEPSSPTYDRDGITFKAHPEIKGSSSSDYANNDYDKGHMAPANTFACSEKWLKETFSYANCALQHKGLNRGTWAQLETPTLLEFHQVLLNLSLGLNMMVKKRLFHLIFQTKILLVRLFGNFR